MVCDDVIPAAVAFLAMQRQRSFLGNVKSPVRHINAAEAVNVLRIF